VCACVRARGQVFTFLFFVMVTTILMNIIFGIIIDTFAELREKREKVRERERKERRERRERERKERATKYREERESEIERGKRPCPRRPRCPLRSLWCAGRRRRHH
jgi:site-specific DNA-adenine methylase